MKTIVTIFLSALAFILSVAALCISAYRTPELGFDYQGAIAGILSLLITILLGWQIFNVIDMKSTQKRLDRGMKEIELMKESYNMLSIYVEAQCYDLSGHSHFIQERYVEAIEQTLKSLLLYSKITTYKDVLVCIEQCFENYAFSLRDVEYPLDGIDKKNYAKIMTTLRSNPPRFNTPAQNEAMQWLFEFTASHEDKLEETLTAEQIQKLNEFINLHEERKNALKQTYQQG